MTPPDRTAVMRSAVVAGTTPAATRVRLLGQPRSVLAARRTTRHVLAGCPRANDLAVAVTEQASKCRALVSGRGVRDVHRDRADRAAPTAIEATDPRRAASPAGESNGRGLGITAPSPTGAGSHADPAPPARDGQRSPGPRTPPRP
jgi:hypothetical protein